MVRDPGDQKREKNKKRTKRTEKKREKKEEKVRFLVLYIQFFIFRRLVLGASTQVPAVRKRENQNFVRPPYLYI